jgi:hypothetical protein
MDRLIALLLCSSPFIGSPTACYYKHVAPVHHAVAIETDGLRAVPYPYVMPVADTPDSASATGRWQAFVAEAAQRFGIPQAWIRAVMLAESRGQATVEGRPIVSPAGAIGLMQVMPQTYAEMRRRHDLGPDPGDPHDNILAGTAYLREMLDRFGYPHLFAAYNAGPDRFEAYRRGEQALPAETQAYLAQLEVNLGHAADSTVPASAPSFQSAAVERSRPLNPLLFFPLGRHSTLFAKGHDPAPPTEPPDLDTTRGQTRNKPLLVSPRNPSLSPGSEQGPP